MKRGKGNQVVVALFIIMAVLLLLILLTRHVNTRKTRDKPQYEIKLYRPWPQAEIKHLYSG